MATPTYTLIASATAGSGGSATFDFTSIPNTYTDLVLKTSLRLTAGSNPQQPVSIKFNGSSTGYTYKSVFGDGSSAASYGSGITDRIDMQYANSSISTSSIFNNFEIYIPNYSGSTNKSTSYDSVMENNTTAAYTIFMANLWSNTAAINQITLTPSTGSFAQYSIASLYGIKNS